MYTFETLGVNFERCELKNGSQMFLFKKKGAPLYIRASINAGTRWNNIPGTAHFVEHMIVAGSKKFPSKNLLAEQIEKIGGEFSASTNFDSIRVNAQVAQKDDLPVAADLLNEILFNSLFDLKTMETERGAILSELEAKKTNPKMYVVDLFLSLAFQDTYMRYTNLGTEESVSEITVKDIKEFYGNYFSPARTVYLVCGDIEMDELREVLENSINLPSVANNLLPEAPEITRKKSIVVEYFENKESHVTLGFRADAASLKEVAALFILRNILVVGRASILATELRYNKGLVYSVNGMAWFLSGAGVFSISTACSSENLQNVLDIICGELNKININGVSEESFNFVKKKIIKSKFIEMQTSASWIDFNDQFLNSLAREKSTIIDLMNVIEKMTLQEVSEVFRKYIKHGTSYLAVCGGNDPASLKVNY